MKSLFLPLLSSLLAAASPLHPQPRNNAPSNATVGPCPFTLADPDYCKGTASNASLAWTYLCGDWRLGPVMLPTDITLDALVEIYDRFGGLCPGPFLKKWFNETSKSYIYPEQDGFQLDVNGKRIEGNMTLPAGTYIDRFGSENGSYASPAAAPYMQRALPPSNLNTHGDTKYPYSYHIYRVVAPFNVTAGPIAPWFGQPGQGVQYHLKGTVLELVGRGFLERVNLTVLADPESPN